MPIPNPFIQRNLPLSELIARQRRVQANQEGASPTNAYMNRRELGQIGEAIDRYGRPMPQMQRPMQPQPMRPQPRPMQPRPQPMQPRPQPMAPAPMPAPIIAPGVMGPAPGSGAMAGQVSVTGGGVSPPQGPWAGMGMGGGMGLPPVMGGGGTPYGNYPIFGGFSQQQPYRSVNSGMFGGGAMMRDPREMMIGGFR